MPIDLSVPRQNADPLRISLDDGQCVFVLGANGTGKSGLMHAFYKAHHTSARRISAHRQTWLSSSSLNLSPEGKRNTELNIQGSDRQDNARWMDNLSAQRADLAIFDLIDAENVRARQITGAVDNDDFELARRLSKKDAPIKIINELLRLSSIPIKISVQQNEKVMASKAGSDPYSVAELSDGERNVLLIAATILTVESGTLLLIDEPERHLHRSIISPLLTLLLQKRTDCKFVVSTHDVLLPLDNPAARTILIRSCKYAQGRVVNWDIDLLPADAPIDEAEKKDILGARRNVLFVEGTQDSLDKPLYSLVFPNASVIAKGGCTQVETAVEGIRAAPDLHWVRAFGLIDNDGRTENEISELKIKGVYALPVYTVESIYYHPKIQSRLAERYTVVTGGHAGARVAAAEEGVLDAVKSHIQRLSARAIEKSIHNEIDRGKPTQTQINAGNLVNITVDVAGVLAEEQKKLEAFIRERNVEMIICRYPVRDTPALDVIARQIGFQDRKQYEDAVRKLLMDDAEVLTIVRGLFDTLYSDLTN